MILTERQLNILNHRTVDGADADEMKIKVNKVKTDIPKE